jgi:tRNA(Ile)-lysidine synthase
MAEASALLDELAAHDALLCLHEQQLNVQELAQLSNARAKNVLRWWLVAQHQLMPSTARLQEMLNQLIDAKTDARIKVAIGGGAWLRRYRNLAYIESNVAATPIEMMWKGEHALVLPDQSRLRFEKVKGTTSEVTGLAYKRLGIHTLRVSHRNGGERFKPDANRPTRTLKHLLQDANIPPWQRERLPLIYLDDTLAVVPYIGVASHFQATEDEESLVITWLPPLV